MTIRLLIQRKSREQTRCALSKQRRGGCSQASPGCPLPAHPNSQRVLSLAPCRGVGGGRRRKEGEQELPLVELSLAMNSCLGAGHGAQGAEQGQQSPCRCCWGWSWGVTRKIWEEMPVFVLVEGVTALQSMLRKRICVSFLRLCFHDII